MRNLYLFLMLLLCIPIAACTQPDKQVGGPCEGCEALYEYGDKALNSTDTIPGFDESSEKMIVHGIIYESNAKTPAANVILYLYHTNEKGIYAAPENPKGWERRHGKHRGWIKTGKDGSYTFYTFRPDSYPNSSVAQHIHATVKPPGYTEYYIDSYLFSDDPNLSEAELHDQQDRGGSGIIDLKVEQGMLVAERDIILGKNIPGY